MQKKSLQTKTTDIRKEKSYITMERGKVIMLVMVILPCLIIFSQAQATDQVDSGKIELCICPEKDPPCPNGLCFCCALEQERCFRTRKECICEPGCHQPPSDASYSRPLSLP
ncbi:hypothetical protein ACQJBY_031717 [Aegilops geniculata]